MAIFRSESHSAFDINYKSRFILRFDKNLPKIDYGKPSTRDRSQIRREILSKYSSNPGFSGYISLSSFLSPSERGLLASEGYPKTRLENVNLIETHVITNASRIRTSVTHWELLSRLRIVLDFNHSGITGAYKCRMIYDRSCLMSAQIREATLHAENCSVSVSAIRYIPISSGRCCNYTMNFQLTNRAFVQLVRFGDEGRDGESGGCIIWGGDGCIIFQKAAGYIRDAYPINV